MALSQFDLARQRASQQANAATQQQQEAIKRRFASMGGLGSGAAMKQEQLAAQKAQEQLGGQMEGIQAAETEQAKQEADVLKAREFAKAEREAGQQFASGERSASQEFAAKQAAQDKEWQAQQAALGREFATSERTAGQAFSAGQFEKQLAWQKTVQAWNERQAFSEMDLALKNYNLEKEAQDFNTRLAAATAASEGIQVAVPQSSATGPNAVPTTVLYETPKPPPKAPVVRTPARGRGGY